MLNKRKPHLRRQFKDSQAKTRDLLNSKPYLSSNNKIINQMVITLEILMGLLLHPIMMTF